MIAAVDARLGIANEQGIPWAGKIPLDTQYFQDQTAEGAIVMGYQTYEEFDRPLHDRENFVLTHAGTKALRAGFVGVSDLTEFFDEHAGELVWVIGGAGLFAASIGNAEQLFLTRLDEDFHCTKFFPNFVGTFELLSEVGPHVQGGVSFTFQIWQRSSS
jgi:dihydrofolate reductase